MTILCSKCGKPMTLLDQATQRWYCFSDDELYFATEDEWKSKEYSAGDALGDLSTTGVAGVVWGAVSTKLANDGRVKNRPIRENLIATLNKDPRYVEAFKEWWGKAYPTKPYTFENLVSFTTENVRAGWISLKKDKIKFDGPAKALGDLYAVTQSSH